MEILGYTLIETCGCCPEQYDVFKDDKEVGYLRLRHGYFAARYPGVSGEVVYSSNTVGDGVFEEHERMYHLTKAIIEIDKKRLEYESFNHNS